MRRREGRRKGRRRGEEERGGGQVNHPPLLYKYRTAVAIVPSVDVSELNCACSYCL